MTRPRLLAAVTAGIAVAALTAGCGVRIGSPPAPIPSPDQVETLRQALARNASEVVDLTDRVDSEAPAELFESISVSAVDQVHDLGGLWVPPPRPEDPEESPTDPSTSPTGEPTGISTRTAVAELSASLAQVDRLVADDLPHEWTAVVGSLLLSRRSMVAAGRDALGLDCGTLCPEPVAAVSLMDGPTKDAIISHLDAIGYLSEIAAARASGEEREALADRAARYRQSAATMVGPRAGTDADPRRPAYSIADDGLLTSIQLLQGELVAGWIAAAAESEGADRDAALEQAWTAYLAAHGGPVVAGAWPGLLSGPEPIEPDRSTP